MTTNRRKMQFTASIRWKIFHCNNNLIKVTFLLTILLPNTIPNVVGRQENDNGIQMKNIEDSVLKYVDDALSLKSFEILSGLRVERNQISSNSTSYSYHNNRQQRSFDDRLMDRIQEFAETHVLNVDVPRAMESTGRLFFFKGLKKMMWPVFIGMQVVKTVLLAMFLPSIIGSLGKIVGKGLSSFSPFIQPSTDTIDDLEFKDTLYPEQEKHSEYTYPQADASTNHFATQMYDSATANNNAMSRYTMDGKRITYIQPPTLTMFTDSRNTMPSMTSKRDNFKVFHDIPTSSMLLTNYDPFYSPLLSRLDAVFQQLGLGKGNEKCREKLVCLMYASPAKYAPYSNLISAQLSRELNELRKPISDNIDILRFFKYMRAAKDGQDGVDCDVNYTDCKDLSNNDSPAMITTYNDINKLVQARKLN